MTGLPAYGGLCRLRSCGCASAKRSGSPTTGLLSLVAKDFAYADAMGKGDTPAFPQLRPAAIEPRSRRLSGREASPAIIVNNTSYHLGMRDDFPLPVKETLAKRVSFRCSNPGCRQPTSGPQEDPTKAINLGVAAHITAASPDGPRYDPALTADARTSAVNGIWLCQSCGKLVDNDAQRYTVAVLQRWKTISEAAALRTLELKGDLGDDDELIFLRLEQRMPDLLMKSATISESDP